MSMTKFITAIAGKRALMQANHCNEHNCKNTNNLNSYTIQIHVIFSPKLPVFGNYSPNSTHQKQQKIIHYSCRAWINVAWI